MYYTYYACYYSLLLVFAMFVAHPPTTTLFWCCTSFKTTISSVLFRTFLSFRPVLSTCLRTAEQRGRYDRYRRRHSSSSSSSSSHNNDDNDVNINGDVNTNGATVCWCEVRISSFSLPSIDLRCLHVHCEGILFLFLLPNRYDGQSHKYIFPCR